LGIAGEWILKMSCNDLITVLVEVACVEISRAYMARCITYELLSQIIERSSSIVSSFKELENIRIDA
jgi:hypothetical protein